jgi:hypothetical protein
VVIHVLIADADQHNGPQIVSAHTDYDHAVAALYAEPRHGLHIESVTVERHAA